MGFVVIVLAVTFACYPLFADPGPRIYAPTVWFHGAIVALGAAMAAGVDDARPRHLGGGGRRLWVPVSGLAMAGVVFVLPLCFRFAHPDLSSLAAPTCKAGETPFAYRVERGSGVTVDAASREDFHWQGQRLPGIDRGTGLTDGGGVFMVFNLLAAKSGGCWNYLVLGHPEDAPKDGQIALACGQLIGSNMWTHSVYSARIVQP
jgi:hypothetical protein